MRSAQTETSQEPGEKQHYVTATSGAVSPVLEATRSTFSLGSVSRPFHTRAVLFPNICTCLGDPRCF